jgi:hypothetical protein
LRQFGFFETPTYQRFTRGQINYNGCDESVHKYYQQHGYEGSRILDKQAPGKNDRRVRKYFILEATEVILKNNTFNFDSKHYVHIKETAMGTHMTPMLHSHSDI